MSEFSKRSTAHREVCDATLGDADEHEESGIVRRPSWVPTRAHRHVLGKNEGQLPMGERGRDRSSGSQRHGERLSTMLNLAKLYLETLPDDHPDARLLRLAILRRDEILLSGVLRDLHARQG